MKYRKGHFKKEWYITDSTGHIVCKGLCKKCIEPIIDFLNSNSPQVEQSDSSPVGSHTTESPKCVKCGEKAKKYHICNNCAVKYLPIV